MRCGTCFGRGPFVRGFPCLVPRARSRLRLRSSRRVSATGSISSSGKRLAGLEVESGAQGRGCNRPRAPRRRISTSTLMPIRSSGERTEFLSRTLTMPSAAPAAAGDPASRSRLGASAWNVGAGLPQEIQILVAQRFRILDVDPPAGQLVGQAGVLPFLADRQRHLIGRHDHRRDLVPPRSA